MDGRRMMAREMSAWWTDKGLEGGWMDGWRVGGWKLKGNHGRWTELCH